MKLTELADRLGATLNGSDGQIEVTGIAAIDRAGPGEVSFVANPKYVSRAQTSRAAALIVDPDFPETAMPTLRIANPYLAFARAIECFYQPPHYAPGVHPTAVIGPGVKLGERAHVGAYVVISDGVTIGDDAVLLSHVILYPGVTVGDRFFAHAHAVVREYCQLGDDVVLQNGAIIGSDGFGFAKGPEGRWVKIMQSGPAILEDRVEIQANACIDRASIGETRIGKGAKIDNLVQMGHGTSVGENTLLCAQVGVAGSTSIGRNVILAGQVGVGGHLAVGDGVIATGQTGITKDAAAKAVLGGNPAMDNRSWLRIMAVFNRLPELLRRVQTLEKAVQAAPEKRAADAADD